MSERSDPTNYEREVGGIPLMGSRPAVASLLMKRPLLLTVVAALVIMSFGLGRASNDQRDLNAVNYATATTPMVDVCTFYDDITAEQSVETLGVALDNWYSILIDNLIRFVVIATHSNIDVLTENSSDLLRGVVTGDMLLESNARAGIAEACEPTGTVRFL